MARLRPTLVLPLLGSLLGALVLASPALAQFSPIFREEPPPVPPADVPNAPPAPQPNGDYYRDKGGYAPNNGGYYRDNGGYSRDSGYYRNDGSYRRQYRNYPDDQMLPPADVPSADVPPADVPRRADVPPPQPLPAPMALPPQRRPGGGVIQSKPLAPLPGTEPTEARTPPRVQPTQPGQPAPPVQPGEAATPTPAVPAAPPTDEVVVEPPPQRIGNPTAVFEGLDKITGRTTTFDVAINETVQFGALQVTPRVCYSRPPTETPQTDSFVEVDEVTLAGKIRRIFTGWMFAASPGLHAVEHPIYDVWLVDCKGGKNPAVADVTPNPEPAKPGRAATRRR
jgi:hypothetical protein